MAGPNAFTGSDKESRSEPMTEEPEIALFASSYALADMRAAMQPLLQTSVAARAAKSRSFEVAFEGWCNRLEEESENTLELTAALWRLSSLSSMARHRQRLQRALRGSYPVLKTPVSSMSDPKDRKAVAEALMLVDQPWVAKYCAEAITHDPDPKSDARDAFCRVLLTRTGEVGSSFETLAEAMGAVTIEQTDVATGRARRITWVLRSMRPALYEDEEAIAETSTGDAYASFVLAGLKSVPADRVAALDAAREILLCLNGVVRLHGVSLAAFPNTYLVLGSLRRRLGWHDWPEELAKACGNIGVRIEEALLSLARQGIADGELRKAYVGLFGEATATRRLARALSRSAPMDEDMAYWLENGRSRIRLETSSALEESALSAVDTDLAKALIELKELRRHDPEGAILKRLGRSIEDAARKRGLVLRGEPGERLQYSPAEHLLDRADVGAREVRLLRPVVDKMVGGRRLGVVLKANVEPA